MTNSSPSSSTPCYKTDLKVLFPDSLLPRIITLTSSLWPLNGLTLILTSAYFPSCPYLIFKFMISEWHLAAILHKFYKEVSRSFLVNPVGQPSSITPIT